MKTTLVALSAVALVLSSGCGGDDKVRRLPDGGDTTASADYLGNWAYDGTWTVEMNGNSETVPDSGQWRIVEGVDSDIVFEGDCSLTADVKGEVATLQPGQSCNQTSAGATMTMQFSSGRAVKTGEVLSFSANGTLTYIAQGATLPGDWTMQLSMQRKSK